MNNPGCICIYIYIHIGYIHEEELEEANADKAIKIDINKDLNA